MKRIFIADVHLSLYSNDKQKNGLPLRLYDIMQSLNQVTEYAVENGIEHIDIGGDINNDKNLFYTKPLLEFHEFLNRNRNIYFTIIPGNHDMDNLSDDQISSSDAFRLYKNVECISNVKIIDNITFVPFSKDIVKVIKSLKPNDVLISHFGLNEAQLSSGISIVSDISIKDLKKFKLVLLGHYHKPQNVKNVYYSGSLTQLSWNEKGEEKRFLVYDTESLDVISVPFKGYTKYVELVLQNKNELDSILKLEERLKKEGNFVRIKNTTNEEIVCEGVHIINTNERDITNRGISNSMTTEEKLRRYLQVKEIPDQDKYMEIAKNIISQVKKENFEQDKHELEDIELDL